MQTDVLLIAKNVLDIENPKTGIVNIGEEAGKGNELAQSAYTILEEEKDKFNFIGNIEGRELFLNHCDIVVCDGFVGNVVLKVTEGTASMLFKMIKSEFKSDFVGMIVGLCAKPFLKRIYEKINYEEFGGMLLLGVKGITVISHGRSKAYAIKNAVRVAKEAVETQVNKKIAESIEAQIKYKTKSIIGNREGYYVMVKVFSSLCNYSNFKFECTE